MFADNYERFARTVFDAYKTVVHNIKEEDVYDARDELDCGENEVAYNVDRIAPFDPDEKFEELSIGGVKFRSSYATIDFESVCLNVFFDVCLGEEERTKALEAYSKTSLSAVWEMDEDAFDQSNFMITYYCKYEDQNRIFTMIADALKTLADNIGVIKNILALEPKKTPKKKTKPKNFTPYTLSGKLGTVVMDSNGNFEFKCAGERVVYTLEDISEVLITKSLFSADVAFYKKGSKDYDNEGVSKFKKEHIDELIAALEERGVPFSFWKK